MTKSTKATIKVEVLDEELDIDEICEPLEERGWMIHYAFIEDDDGNIADP